MAGGKGCFLSYASATLPQHYDHDQNIYFCIAKVQIDDPHGKFWLILLGTDRLEGLFGILRTMVGNDSNVDILQLALHLTGTTEVSTILAQYPEWDQGPCQLKLPALSKDMVQVHDQVDHLKPRLWQGNLLVSDAVLHTCWIHGQLVVEEEFSWIKPILDAIPAESGVDILWPFGVDLVHAECDEVDDTLELEGRNLATSTEDRGARTRH